MRTLACASLCVLVGTGCLDGAGTLPVPSQHRAPVPPAVSPDSDAHVEEEESDSGPEPGHYATDVQYHQESACSRSWDSYWAHGSFVLELATDGTASGCRGKHMSDVGPEYRQEMMEQQGFRGAWHRDGDAVDVTLALDATACPQQRGYTNRDPMPWHLRCVAMGPDGASPITLPVLACAFVEHVYTEELGYVVQGVIPGEWMLLGAGDGVRVTLDQGALMASLRDRFVLSRPAAAITFDAWREAR